MKKIKDLTGFVFLTLAIMLAFVIALSIWEKHLREERGLTKPESAERHNFSVPEYNCARPDSIWEHCNKPADWRVPR